MNEKQLIVDAKSGDFEAFIKLIDANKDKIYALALKMTANKQDAEDIVQETLIKAIDNLDRFREESSFGTWLYAIALNQSRALLVKQKEKDLKPIESYLPSSGKADFDHQDSIIKLFDWKDPHSEMESNELRDIINNAVTELPHQFKEVFLLRYFEELSIKEISKITGESTSSVKSRVLRAKLAVRDKLSKVFEEHYG
jgi:RNA polymerase sigma-70 factor (ECF subfamily)